MAIRPDQVPSVAADELPAVDGMEQAIDVWLRKEYPKGKREFHLPPKHGMTDSGLSELCRRYFRAGWNIVFKQDASGASQRLEFSPLKVEPAYGSGNREG